MSGDSAAVAEPDAIRVDAWLLLGLVLLALGGTVAFQGGLDFAMHKDEVYFWEQTVWFVERWPPGLVELQNYKEPMTPLSFLLWGVFERWFGLGVAGARLVTLACSAAGLGLVGLRWRGGSRAPLLCVVGLLLFPYYLPLSIHVYTDMPATLAVMLGSWLYAHRRPGWAALAFAAGIATRQYMVAYPAALLAAEVTPLLVQRARAWPWRRLLPVALSVASLGGWFLFFGGLGPQAGTQEWPRHNNAIANLKPGYALYFATTIGTYFVVFETLLFRRWHFLQALQSRRALLALAGTLVAYLLLSPFDPSREMGPINRAAVFLLSPLGETLRDAIRLVGASVLAWLALMRFARIDVISWLLLACALMMMVSFEAWEKYNHALLASLWLFRSFSPLEERFELWGAAERARGEP